MNIGWNAMSSIHGLAILRAPVDRLRMLRGRVLIKERVEDVSPEGIVKPETWRDNPKRTEAGAWGYQHQGIVLAMGPPPVTRKGQVEISPEFRVGDEVLFAYALATEEFRRYARDIVAVAYEEVLAVVER